MEYERIHKVQMGVMSPTKLRMKLLGSSHGSPKINDAKKSPRASPVRFAGANDDDDEDDHPKNSLLPQELDEGNFSWLKIISFSDRSDSSRSRSDASHGRAAAGGGNGYDSGGGFEFCRAERSPAIATATAPPFLRQVPSKWNDAEKWLAGRHVVHSNPIFSKKSAAAVAVAGGGGRVAPESASSEAKKSIGSALTEPSSSSPPSVSAPAPATSRNKRPRVSALAAVSMRDVGTEMTPAASKEQSRSGTPAGAATPSLSPLCSVPSSPRSGSGGASSAATATSSERELQIRTRREIAALGLQLGKMSIASWASKEEELAAGASPEKRPRPAAGEVDGGGEEEKRREFEARAVAWQEKQKCKLALRYQRKEVKIQEWESCQKAKFEAKMRHAEVQAEQMKARAKQKLSRRMSALSHKAEGKQARVEARRSRQAARLARQVDRIRETGAAPSRLRRCCSWLFL
uniref:Remorin C-terminal domain-containing protein n=1 Tax=Leersia perrieri TaxID=77586 RepID=A0A0D9Y1E2_9ORYZ